MCGTKITNSSYKHFEKKKQHQQSLHSEVTIQNSPNGCRVFTTVIHSSKSLRQELALSCQEKCPVPFCPAIPFFPEFPYTTTHTLLYKLRLNRIPRRSLDAFGCIGCVKLANVQLIQSTRAYTGRHTSPRSVKQYTLMQK